MITKLILFIFLATFGYLLVMLTASIDGAADMRTRAKVNSQIYRVYRNSNYTVAATKYARANYRRDWKSYK